MENFKVPVEIYLELENVLLENHPEDAAEASKLAGSVIDATVAGSEDIWSVLWDKPLFANARVEIGTRWCGTLRPYMNEAWKVWGNERRGFLISKVGKGTGRSSFVLAGDIALEVAGATGIALHRLNAIQGAAIATRKRSETSATPYRDLRGSDLGSSIAGLQVEFGAGWGPISVLHFLTDLGLAVKPDLHLMRTMRHLSGIPAGQSSRVPNLAEVLDVNRAARRLLDDLDRDSSPQNLRYLDKVLMEISRRNVIERVQAGTASA